MYQNKAGAPIRYYYPKYVEYTTQLTPKAKETTQSSKRQWQNNEDTSLVNAMTINEDDIKKSMGENGDTHDGMTAIDPEELNDDYAGLTDNGNPMGGPSNSLSI